MTEPAMDVVLEDAPHTSILGLLVRSLLLQNLRRPDLCARSRGIRGEILVQAGLMTVTLRFEPERIVVVNGATAAPRARVSAGMKALLDVAAGRGIVMPVLTGAIRIGGNPLLLLKMLPLICAN